MFHRGLLTTALTSLAFLGLPWTKQTMAKGMVAPLEEGAAIAAATAAAAAATRDGTNNTPDAASSSCAKSEGRLELAPSSMEANPSEGVAGGAAAAGRGRSRGLDTIFSFPGDTAKAANSTGIPNGSCDGTSFCVNGCPSLFYKVTGGNGSLVTAGTCQAASFTSYLYVWEGNGTCANFTCVDSFVSVCYRDSQSIATAWRAQTGAEYYIQVLGRSVSFVGKYTLAVVSDAPIEVSEVDVCGTSHPPPNQSPTYAPTDPPTTRVAPMESPTVVPTAPPSEAPTDAPTEVPTNSPSKAPTAAPDPCAGVGPTYWLYDPTTNAPIRRLVNNSATCLLHPYNIEVRPCNAATAVATTPIRVRLLEASGGSPVVVYKSKPQRSAPYVLFGPAPTKGDVLPSPKPLRDGVYYLAAKGAPKWGKLQFTQQCPCPDGTKKMGKKGCMM